MYPVSYLCGEGVPVRVVGQVVGGGAGQSYWGFGEVGGSRECVHPEQLRVSVADAVGFVPGSG